MTDDVDKFESTGEPIIVVGSTGNKGSTGDTGRPGRTGPAGVDATMSTRKVLALFAFVVAVFVLLAYRSEVNADRIRAASYDTAVQLHAQCELNHDNGESLGQVINQVLVSVAARKDLDPEVKRQILKTYTAAKPRVIDCGPKP